MEKLLLFSFHEVFRIEAARFIDEWFVNKQVVVKLHDMRLLIFIEVFI